MQGFFLYSSNIRCLFLAAKNALFELSRIFGGCHPRHARRGLPLRTTKTATEKGIPSLAWIGLSPEGAIMDSIEHRRMKILPGDIVTDRLPIADRNTINDSISTFPGLFCLVRFRKPPVS